MNYCDGRNMHWLVRRCSAAKLGMEMGLVDSVTLRLLVLAVFLDVALRVLVKECFGVDLSSTHSGWGTFQ